jgi:cytochrome d ubiquinol oxidase subunit I
VMKTGVIMAAVLTPLQIFIGDLHGLNTLEHQPAKIAAMEAIWDTQRGAAFTLIGLPDEATRSTHYAIEIPYAASLILTHSADGEVKGLNEYEGQHPPVAIVFWSFRVMLGMGVLMLLVSWWTAWQFLRGKALGRWQLLALSAMTFSGWVATLAGWYVTEIGRQPWIIYGLVSSAEVAADHASATLTGTLLGYIGLYVFLLISYIQALRYLASKPAQSLSLLPDSLLPQTKGHPATGKSS